MKKVLLEYANIIGNTVTGLVFGLAFFLLFINFYHAKELAEGADISAFTATNQQNASTKIATIKENSNSYHQNSYGGKESIYDMNAVQLKLNSCVTIFESEEAQKFVNKTQISLKDAYDFNNFYQNTILNDCLIMQMSALTADDGTITIGALSQIKPFIRLTVEQLLSSPSYISNNIKNADSYYYTSDTNRTTIFDLTKDSYFYTMSNYQNTLDLLVEISNWYKGVVLGG